MAATIPVATAFIFSFFGGEERFGQNEFFKQIAYGYGQE
jgi:hypothetical protein